MMTPDKKTKKKNILTASSNIGIYGFFIFFHSL